jgi:cellulose synthase/poly-beta-1,6-N-acetylglucosamine synthase-like glycosyltransferase
MTQFLQYLFWISIIIVFYTYIGYGILLYILVKIKEKLHPEQPLTLPEPLPDVTLLIAAYNEEKIIKAKMDNCATLDYPKDKLHVIWVTDGSTDSTNMLLATYPNVTVLFSPERRGKTAALNRAMPFIKTSYTIFTDANTMLNVIKLPIATRPTPLNPAPRICTKNKNAKYALQQGAYNLSLG